MIGCKNGPFQDVVHTEKNDFPLAMLLYPSKKKHVGSKDKYQVQNHVHLRGGYPHPFAKYARAKMRKRSSPFFSG